MARAAPETKGKTVVQEHLLKQWKVLLPAVTWLMTTIGSFWFPAPPGLVTADSGAMVSFARFVATVSTGLMILPMQKYCRRSHAWLWGKVALGSAILSVAAFLSYLHLEQSWTVKRGGTVIYIGTEVKPDVAEFVRVYQPPTEELLESAGWVPSRVWTERSIERCRLTLSAIYILGIPLFVIALVSVAQGAYCVSGKE